MAAKQYVPHHCCHGIGDTVWASGYCEYVIYAAVDAYKGDDFAFHQLWRIVSFGVCHYCGNDFESNTQAIVRETRRSIWGTLLTSGRS